MGKVFQKVKREQAITHKIMSAIRSKDTKMEIVLRKELWHRGLRYRKNYRKLPGKPDIVFLRTKIAIFIDGDFWHGHNWAIRNYGSQAEEMKRYSPFWQNKIKRNIERDLDQTISLRDDGWIVLRYWESDIKDNLLRIADEIEDLYLRKIGVRLWKRKL